jgi:hypothetical protein
MPSRPIRAVELRNEPEPCQQAQAIEKHAEAIDRLTERFGPAADTVAGFGERMDALCKFFKGWKPWVGVALVTAIWRSPDQAPELFQQALKFFGLGS